MDDFERIMDEADREGVKASQGIIKLLLKMWDGARSDVQAAISAAKRNRMVSVVSALIAAACLCACIYQGTVIQRQGSEISALRGEVESIHKILDAGVVIEETVTTTETTSQTIEGDTATINNVDGEQYNDSATNGGGN